MSIRSLKKVVVIGAGNWGTVVAKIVAENVCKAPTKFSSTVSLWTHQETVNDRLLTDIINTTRVNEKYLPGVVLPTNIVSEACLKTAITGASLLVFVCPHQFVDRILAQIKESSHLLGEEPMAISLIKGLLEPSKIEKKLGLISSHIKSQLNLSSINVLMGANIASEIAKEQFTETTLGHESYDEAMLFKSIFQTPYFRVNLIKDVIGVELCGGLKNIVALGTGIASGLGYGANTRAAVIRIGLVEMRRFIKMFWPGEEGVERVETFFESCGVADLIATCESGRNARLAAAYVKVERDMLNGQSCQGKGTADEVREMIVAKGCTHQFPLFVAIHEIISQGRDPKTLLRDI